VAGATRQFRAEIPPTRAWPGFGTKKIAAPDVGLPKRKVQRKIEPRIATHLHSDMNRSLPREAPPQ
jgi:hypothetical protein